MTHPAVSFDGPDGSAYTSTRVVWRPQDHALMQIATATSGPKRYLSVDVGAAQHVVEYAMTAPTGEPSGYPSGTSSFVFEIPDGAWGGTAVDALTDDQLLDWSGLVPVLDPRAASTPFALTSVQLGRAATDPGAPSAASTLELPARLVVSPTEFATWDFPTGLITRNGRTDIWFARLEQPHPDDPAASPAEAITMRAIWAEDFVDVVPGPGADGWLPDAFAGRDRCSLVWLTGVFQAGTPAASPLTALQADRVSVSMLGGSIRVGADLAPLGSAYSTLLTQRVAAGESHPYGVLPDDGAGVGVLQLQCFHRDISSGRDISAFKAELCHARFWGVTLLITERFARQIDDEAGPPTAWWVETVQSITVLTHTMQPPDGVTARTSAGAPAPTWFEPLIDTVTVTDTTFPAVQIAGDGSVTAVPSGQPVLLHLRITDRAGNVSRLTAPLVVDDWPDNAAEAPTAISQTLRWHQQRLCLHPAAASTATFEADQVTVVAARSAAAAAAPTFVVTTATVRHPGLRQLDPGHPDQVVLLPLGQGQPGASLPGAGPLSDTVFAHLQTPLSPAWPPAASGRAGLSSSQVPVDALSAQHGAVHHRTDGAAPSPADVWGVSRLLGLIPVADLGLVEVPVVSSQRDATSASTTMRYGQTFDPPAPFALDVVSGSLAALEVTVVATRPTTSSGPPATTSVTETMTGLRLDLAVPPATSPNVSISFDSLTFAETDGQRPTLIPSGQQLTFEGDLEFVGAVLAYLPGDLFSNPPQLTVDGEQAMLSYVLALPAFEVGAFTLSDVSITAAVAISLPVLGGSPPPPGVTLSLASRDDPFTVAVGILGGGGWFDLTLLPGGTVVDAGIDFGGMFGFDVVVASGSVSLTGGVRLVAPTDGGATVTGFIHFSGGLEILDIASVSIDVMLTLAYDTGNHVFTGSADVSVRVSVFMFHKTIDWSVTQTFSSGIGTSSASAVGPRRASASRAIPEAPPLHPDPGAFSWAAYAAAFAPRSNA